MIEQRPYMPHELDVHPDRLRIEATIKKAVEANTVRCLEDELETLTRQRGHWVDMYIEANAKLSRIKQALDGVI